MLGDPTATWKYVSPASPGLHEVISPANSVCKVTWVFRLNLAAGASIVLKRDDLELNGAVIRGAVTVRCGGQTERLGRLDSFYLPGKREATLTAHEDSFLYLGGGPWEGVGEFFVRRFDATLPLGSIRQIHGKPPYQRMVFMTVNPEVPASRLICGFTFGEDGAWTSWPPHQHSADLEEAYCYFGIPAPKFALHLSYVAPGRLGTIHAVSEGDCVVVPEGYHPTVAAPGVRSAYFWVMVAHRRGSRRYDLAVPDPHFVP